MNTLSYKVGMRVRMYRQKRGLTQEELAEKAELHNTYIGQVERGEKNPTVISLGKILNALDVTFAEFFEHLEMKESEISIATQCYDLICSKSESEQKKLYQVLQIIDQLM